MSTEKDAEMAVLGAVLLDNESFWKIAGALTPADFGYPKHAVIFATMTRLMTRGERVDYLTLTDAGLQDAGGLVDIGQSVVTSQGIVHHAALVKKAAQLRALAQVGVELTALAQDTTQDAHSCLVRAVRTLSACLSTKSTATALKDVLADTLALIERLGSASSKLIGITTGWNQLDYLTGGFQPGQNIVLAGRVGMGKSSASLHLARAAAQAGSPVAILTLEMSRMQLALRLLARETNLSYGVLRRGIAPDAGAWPSLTRAANDLAQAPIYLVEMDQVTMLDILQVGRQLVIQHGIKLLVIDNMNLVAGAHEYKSMSENSRLVKLGAKELNIPIVALYQLKREVDSKPDPHPVLSDLKQSGSIENDADLVLLLFRQGYYEDTGETSQDAELELAKHRDGPTGVIQCQWHPDTMSFTE
mgnify:FL=1